MERAVIAVGVKKTGDLPELQAAIESAAQLAEWAKAQGIPDERIKLITDAEGPVTRQAIFDAVRDITELGFIEQLIVYFSGHGVSVGNVERWLLSGAPDDSGAAVDVTSTEYSARFCGVGHVVLISDACRTAADSIGVQRVVGGEIFPNPKHFSDMRPVDRFFATRVGEAAYEVRDVRTSASAYVAAFSRVLLKALSGGEPSVLEIGKEGRFLRPRPLRAHLRSAVPRYFNELNRGVSSEPYAIIESDSDAWLAQLPLPDPAAAPPPAADTSKRRRAIRGRPSDATGEEHLPPVGAGGAATAAEGEPDVTMGLRDALVPPPTMLSKRRASARSRSATAANRTLERFETLAAAGRARFGPEHMETRCGIKVRGATIAYAFAGGGTANVGQQQDIVVIDGLTADRRGTNVFVRLDDGSAVVVPALREFITGLSFNREGALQDVWCEPSANSSLWPLYVHAGDEIRRLRAFIAASTALGVFRIEGTEEADALIERLRANKAADPALAVYAAYALSDRRMIDQIRDMQRYLDETLGVRIFDVEMLALTLGASRTRSHPVEMYPCVPMLTQGWSLLGPLDIALPADLMALRTELRPSLWTHFAPWAADRLLKVLQQGKVD